MIFFIEYVLIFRTLTLESVLSLASKTGAGEGGEEASTTS